MVEVDGVDAVLYAGSSQVIHMRHLAAPCYSMQDDDRLLVFEMMVCFNFRHYVKHNFPISFVFDVDSLLLVPFFVSKDAWSLEPPNDAESSVEVVPDWVVALELLVGEKANLPMRFLKGRFSR